MNLKMAGIDFTRAGIDVRQRFSFTRKAMTLALEQIRQNQEILGCVLLSTCNRMELWLSLTQETQLVLPDFLCRLKGLPPEEYRGYLAVREQAQAVEHLFYLSAGLKSQIMGEDQILTQVKEALAFAREQDSTDRLLEVLFRMAVTAGKRVKTNVVLDKANFSAAHQALDFLKKQGVSVVGESCLVIGNGEMGKLTAQVLMEEGADVTVTVRQYHSGMVNIPQGAKRIDYGERYHSIPGCRLIVSATASPNFTITAGELRACLRKAAWKRQKISRDQIYVDLAVPRDLEPSIAELEGVTCYDMDSLPVDTQSAKMRRQYRQAEKILAEEMQKFFDWQQCRNLIPRIQKIGADAAKEITRRMEKPVKELALGEKERERFQGQLEKTAGKVVDKLLFALRDQAGQDTLQKVVEVLEHIYGSDTEG